MAILGQPSHLQGWRAHLTNVLSERDRSDAPKVNLCWSERNIQVQYRAEAQKGMSGNGMYTSYDLLVWEKTPPPLHETSSSRIKAASAHETVKLIAVHRHVGS